MSVVTRKVEVHVSTLSSKQDVEEALTAFFLEMNLHHVVQSFLSVPPRGAVLEVTFGNESEIERSLVDARNAAGYHASTEAWVR